MVSADTMELTRPEKDDIFDDLSEKDIKVMEKKTTDPKVNVPPAGGQEKKPLPFLSSDLLNPDEDIVRKVMISPLNRADMKSNSTFMDVGDANSHHMKSEMISEGTDIKPGSMSSQN